MHPRGLHIIIDANIIDCSPDIGLAIHAQLHLRRHQGATADQRVLPHNPKALGLLAQGVRDELLAEFTKITRNDREHRWQCVELGGGGSARSCSAS
jgi:hypothetical protein